MKTIALLHITKRSRLMSSNDKRAPDMIRCLIRERSIGFLITWLGEKGAAVDQDFVFAY